MREPTKIELAYCAGTLDSDGHIGVHVNWYRVKYLGDAKQPTFQPRMSVKQIDHGATSLFHELFAGHHYIDESAAKRGSGRPMNVWQVHSRAAGVVLRQIQPYLRIKTRQCELAIELCEINASPRSRRHEVPEIIPGEPMVPLAEAAERAGRAYHTAMQSVRLENIPFTKRPRKGLKRGESMYHVPESFIPIWRDRQQVPYRRKELTDRMYEITEEMKSLNSGARGQRFDTPKRA